MLLLYHILALIKFVATLCTVATALFSSRLDYANSILYGIPAKHKIPLHVLSQVLALLTPAHPPRRDSIGSPSTLVLYQVQNSYTLTFKVLNGLTPATLHNISLVCFIGIRHNPCRALRSASANLLSVARSNLSFGSRAFRDIMIQLRGCAKSSTGIPLRASRSEHSLDAARSDAKTSRDSRW